MKVTIVIWEPGVEIPLSEVESEMFALPDVGANYWRDQSPYTVRDIERSRPLRVHLVRDDVREKLLYGHLPTGYRIDAGRDSGDGHWHAEIQDTRGTVRAWAFSDDCDTAVEDAVTQASKSLPNNTR